jgi:hypothetical protein
MNTKHLVVAAVGGLLAASVATSGEAVNAKRGRVDLDPPSFTHPTEITNPLFPISGLDQVIQLGAEGDVQLRHEITLLEETKNINWNGQDIEAVVSQFVAYGDGEILEIATDYFAQADDGAVWYLGEDVTNYEDGEVLDHDGTWLAGRDGPAGMIMPANPQVGDMFRPENIPGLVFEEVTVMKTGLTVEGPTGPVPDSILVQEALLDGSLEDKYYAPGYGEFQAIVAESDELVTVAVAAPTDHTDAREPRALDRLSDLSDRLYRATTGRGWSRLEFLARAVRRDAKMVNASVAPPFLRDQLNAAVASVDDAIEARSRKDLRQGAIDLELSTLDVELRFDDGDDVDEDRIGAWLRQVKLDRAAGDAIAVASDRVILGAIRTRLGD